MMVGKRKNLLAYLMKKDIERYRAIIEKLNIRKLSSIYNERIQKAINEMAAEMNASSYKSFQVWKGNLAAIIEENITEYNPQLRDMSDMIKEETEKIAELEENQATIRASLNAIEELMEWKVLE